MYYPADNGVFKNIFQGPNVDLKKSWEKYLDFLGKIFQKY